MNSQFKASILDLQRFELFRFVVAIYVYIALHLVNILGVSVASLKMNYVLKALKN